MKKIKFRTFIFSRQYDPEMVDFFKRGQHVSEKLRKDTEFMSRVSPDIWLEDCQNFKQLEPVDKSLFEKYQHFVINCEKHMQDPRFCLGTISDKNLTNYLANGPDHWLLLGAEYDPLRDDLLIWKNRLQKLQPSLSLTCWIAKNAPHGFFNLASVLGGFMPHYDHVIIKWVNEIKNTLKI